ncbi:MAG: hypothetical protein WBD58_14685 [Geitlerinemataceae cyanobacterium]
MSVVCICTVLFLVSLQTAASIPGIADEETLDAEPFPNNVSSPTN